MINEIKNIKHKGLHRPSSTCRIYLLGSHRRNLVNFLSPWGVVNMFLKQINVEPIFFLAEKGNFQAISHSKQHMEGIGLGTIITLQPWQESTLSYMKRQKSMEPVNFKVDPYNPALPLTDSRYHADLRLGQIMGNGFEQIFVLQNPMNLSVSVFETYTYPWDCADDFPSGTTVGLFTSVIGTIFLLLSNKLHRC